MHRDEVLHFLSYINSPKVDFTSEDSWLLGQLSLLLLKRQEQDEHRFAALAMEIFRQHPRFHQLRRICLARRLGLANQLLVQSCEQVSPENNSMLPGYSCFVDAQGSLFKMKASELRVYANASHVVDSYKRNGRIPQRSIARIAAMGIKAGKCLPLFHGKHRIGFAFLNSDDENFKAFAPADYTILSYFSLIATTAITQYWQISDTYYQLAQRHQTTYHGEILAADLLKKTIEDHATTLNQPHLPTQVTVEAHSNLLSHGNLANVLSRLAVSTRAKNLAIQICEQGEKLEIDVHLEGGRMIEPNLLAFESIWMDLKALHYQPRLQNQSIKLEIPREPVDPKSDLRYSI